MKALCLIIPCYNERLRLKLEDFKQYDNAVHFIFVDDGSSDNTSDLIRANLPESAALVILNKNQGKAEAVRQGLLYSLSSPELSNCTWFGYWDADLATPLFEVENMLLFRKFFAPQAQAIFGSRVQRAGCEISRSLLRHYLGRVFVTISSLTLGSKVYDSQCGAKLFSRACAELVCNKPFISKWIFDLEIVLRLKNQAIVEYPLKQWTDIAGSKVKIARESLRVLRDLYKIKKIYLKRRNVSFSQERST